MMNILDKLMESCVPKEKRKLVNLIVIVAGYTAPMEKFFESNSGLKSRFNTFIEFPDSEVDELEKILFYV